MNTVRLLLFPLVLLIFPGWDSTIEFPKMDPLEGIYLNGLAAECALENRAFGAGEEIVYTVYYRLGFIWIPAGEVTFRVEENDQFYFFDAFGRTFSSYDRFFRVRDHYQSQVDKQSLMPVRAVRNIEEGSYRKYATLDFDYRNGQIIANHGRSKDKLERDVLDLDRCMHDVLSIVYYSRNMDISNVRKNDMLQMAVSLDDKTYNVGMRYLGREDNMRIRRAGGRFDVLKFSPQVIAGNVFKDGDEMTVWVSNDRNRIPLMIESPLTVGSIRVVLDSYEGLRHDFTAMR
jgi:hypothetical protein